MYNNAPYMISRLSGWTKQAGHSSEFVYYTEAEAGNPSGNAENIKEIRYINAGGNTVLIERFEYNANDLIIKISSE